MDKKKVLWILIAFLIGFFLKFIIENLVCQNVCPLVEGKLSSFWHRGNGATNWNSDYPSLAGRNYQTREDGVNAEKRVDKQAARKREADMRMESAKRVVEAKRREKVEKASSMRQLGEMADKDYLTKRGYTHRAAQLQETPELQIETPAGEAGTMFGRVNVSFRHDEETLEEQEAKQVVAADEEMLDELKAARVVESDAERVAVDAEVAEAEAIQAARRTAILDKGRTPEEQVAAAVRVEADRVAMEEFYNGLKKKEAERQVAAARAAEADKMRVVSGQDNMPPLPTDWSLVKKPTGGQLAKAKENALLQTREQRAVGRKAARQARDAFPVHAREAGPVEALSELRFENELEASLVRAAGVDEKNKALDEKDKALDVKDKAYSLAQMVRFGPSARQTWRAD